MEKNLSSGNSMLQLLYLSHESRLTLWCAAISPGQNDIHLPVNFIQHRGGRISTGCTGHQTNSHT